jgi:type IV pilus assembly protein PilA
VKIFCSKCGLAKEIEDTAMTAFVTCVSCGHRFSARPAGSSSGTNTALIVVAAVVAIPVVIAVIGILAAIAIPNFIKFQSRSKQTECKTNLKAFATASRAYFEEHHEYTALASKLGFAPERGNRYAYFLGHGTMEDRSAATAIHADTDTQIGVDVFKFGPGTGITETNLPPALVGGVEPGVSDPCPGCSVVAACAGNIDNDATLDVWSVSSLDRRNSKGELIPAFTPTNDVNDTTE